MSTIDLDPWGGETNRSSNAAFQPQRYTSYERDGNSNDQAGARTYHGFWMRFDQPDPFDGSANLSEPQSFNRYSYVQNDPVNSVDPTGLVLSDNGFCGAQYSFSDCGGWGGIQGGYFGGGYAEYQREYGGLPEHIAEELARHNSIISTGYDPTLGIFRGTVQVSGTGSGGTATATLRNPTRQALDRIVAVIYLQVAGLAQYIIGTTTPRGGGLSFQFDPQSEKAIFAILNNTAIFLTGAFGRLHKDDVGGSPYSDYRSITGTLGSRSLQVVVNTRTFLAYADTDRFNPYQDLRGFFGHVFLELIPHRLRRIFGGG